MNFSDYMKSLSGKRTSERGEKVREIAAACCKSELTVYAWTRGQVPDALNQKVVSEMLGIPAEELFPQYDQDGRGKAAGGTGGHPETAGGGQKRRGNRRAP